MQCSMQGVQLGRVQLHGAKASTVRKHPTLRCTRPFTRQRLTCTTTAAASRTDKLDSAQIPGGLPLDRRTVLGGLLLAPLMPLLKVDGAEASTLSKGAKVGLSGAALPIVFIHQMLRDFGK